MINIQITPAYGGSNGWYRAEGHAGPGEELVCNSVTAIEECLAANLDGCWGVTLKRKKADGLYDLRWGKSERKGFGIERANRAAGFAYNGLKALADTYPEIVQVEWKKPYTERRE